MKKRLISLLLTLSMVFGMVPMLGIGVGAIGYSHNASNMCYLIPYAYYANKYSSHEYFIVHYNINGTLNATNLESSFNNSVTTGIANSLDEASWIEKSSEVCVQLLQKVFNPTGDFTVTDLYDTLLINMLLDKAVTTLSSSTDTIKDIASSTTGLLSTTVKVVDAGGSGVADAISFHQLLTSLGDDGWTAFKNTLKADYFEASNFDIYNIKIGDKTAYVEANVIDNFLQHSSRGKVSVKSIEETFDMLNNCMTAVNKLSEVADMYSNALLIKQSVTSDAAVLLDKMQDETDNLFLSTAINKYINLINSGDIDAFMTAVLAKQATEYTVELLVDCMKKALEKNPVYKAGQCVFTIADFISNFDDQGTFSEKSEMLFVLHSLVTIDTAVIEAMKSIEQECIDNYEDIDSVNMCNAYITGMLMSYRLQSVELDYGQKYMTVWYGEKEFEKLLGNSEAWEQWETSIKRQKNHLDSWKPLAFITGDGTGKTNSIMTWYNLCMDVINKGTEIYYVSEGSIFTQQTKPYGQKIQITDSVPVREGYAFSGWRNYSVTCQPKEELDQYLKGTKYELNPCFCGNELWLNAQWDDIDAITYIADKATNVPASHENKGVLSNQIPKKTGYTFLGWDEDATAQKPTYKAGDPITKTGDVTLYAIWEKAVFNIIFDANGGAFDDEGKVTEVTKPKTYNEDFIFDVAEPKRDGYTFMGWSLNNDNTVDWKTGDHDNDIGDPSANDKRVYAVWGSYEVVYDYNDGSIPVPVNVPAKVNGTTYHKILEPDRDKNYVDQYFKGWMFQDVNGDYWWATNTDDLGNVSIVQPGTSVPLSGRLVLYAKWDYYVHYNYGTAYDHDIVRDGNDYVIKEPADNGDLTFKGWQDKETGKILQPGDKIDLTSDMTLNARWAKDDVVISYATLTYDANGGSGRITPETVEAGTKVTLADGTSLSRSGYQFSGWAENRNATTAVYDAGDKFKVNDDVTLYAVWTAVGSKTPSTVTLSSDKEVYEPGDIAIITVNADNSDHFYLDVSDGEGFTMQRPDGTTNHTGGTFIEKTSEYDGMYENRYTNGEDYEIEVYIPDDCQEGEYKITVKATDGLYDGESGSLGAEFFANDEIIIIVKNGGADEVIEVNIKKSKVTMHEGDPETLKVTVYPDKYEDDVVWTSANEDVATVNSKGKVRAVGIGSTTITATVKGVSDTCQIVVEKCDFSKKNTDDDFLKKAATCTSYAEYYYSCECGYAGDETFFDEAGGYGDHKYGAWTTTTEPTETEAGVKQRTCSVCFGVEEEEISALGHSYSDEWFWDETNHWHECDCGEKSDEAAHADENSDGKCDECDYVVETEGSHEHEPADEWESDDTYHWHECTGEDCDEPLNKAAHADEDSDGECDVCGYPMDVAHEHEPADEWESDETGHWHECTGEDCDELLDKAAHADEDGDGKCDECDYVVETEEPHEHEFGTEWESDETGHWHECECGEKSDEAEHNESTWIIDEYATEFKEGSKHTECTVCGYVMQTESIPVKDSDFEYDDWYYHMMILMNQKYTITANAGEGGSISNEGKTTVKYSNNITYTITPDEGYEIEAVIVDGKNVGAVSEYTFKRVQKDHTISVIFTETKWDNPFTDVAENDWYYEDVEFVYENDLMIGTSDTKFSPDAIVNRAMIVTILWRLEGSPVVEGTVDFTDVPAGEWYTDAVNWASANGIVNGYGNDTFGPLNDLTREQIMAILNRYAAYKEWTDDVIFPMIPQYNYSIWAENNVIWADMNGMLDGIGVDVSDLTKAASRAEIAAYLRRFCENIVE